MVFNCVMNCCLKHSYRFISDMLIMLHLVHKLENSKNEDFESCNSCIWHLRNQKLLLMVNLNKLQQVCSSGRFPF